MTTERILVYAVLGFVAYKVVTKDSGPAVALAPPAAAEPPRTSTILGLLTENMSHRLGLDRKDLF